MGQTGSVTPVRTNTEQTESTGTSDEILGVNDSIKLTEAETQILTAQNNLSNRFHIMATFENYQAIRQHDEIYRKGLGSTVYRLYVLGMKTHLTVNDPLTKEERDEFNTEVARLLTSEKLTSKDLDKMWSLYYATGDRKFPCRIKIIAEGTDNTSQHQLVRDAANWSYNSHVKQGLL